MQMLFLPSKGANYTLMVCLLWQISTLLAPKIWAQLPLQIEGRVIDTETEDPLSGATIKAQSGSVTLVETCDLDGHYAITIPILNPNDSIRLEVSMIGYQIQKRSIWPINLSANPNNESLRLNFYLPATPFLMNIVEIKTRCHIIPKDWTGTYTTLDAKTLTERNLGQDLPMLIEQTPSVQVTSDAGNGVGYTSLRIRGTDATRINVTLNDVPVNDGESHQVYWVDLPDLASGTGSLQIQRGVGTSTNGTSAFGASINLQTAEINTQPFVQADNSYGSFNTHKHTLQFGTGVLPFNTATKTEKGNEKYWGIEARLSKIASDGYIDRATSDLQALQLTGHYQSPKSNLRLLYIDGHEKTYQAWGGVPEELLATNRTYNPYTYNQQIDNYRQTHLQLRYTQHFIGLDAAATLFYTKGKGFYEQFRENQTLADYGLQPDSIWANNNIPIEIGNVIPRLWLDNHFYGLTYNMQNKYTVFSWVAGGAISRYDGLHFGEVIWAQYVQNDSIRQRFYEGNSQKIDGNLYAKVNYRFTKIPLSLFTDLQYRLINYTTKGIDENKGSYNIKANYRFFNPKVGVSYRINNRQNLYVTYGLAQREPTRSNFIDNDTLPQPERLHNLEIGYRYEKAQYLLTANAYLMNYQNQLIPTGNLNSVGAPIQQNIPKSYRIGIELGALLKWDKYLDWQANITVSQNKINAFGLQTVVFSPDFDYLRDTLIQYQNTNIAFSPNIIAASTLTYHAPLNINIALNTKFIGRQYLDNTSNKTRSLNPYLVNNLQLTCNIKQRVFKQLELTFLVNNVLNTLYSANGWTYFLLFAQNTDSAPNTVNYNNYYPQAGINYLAGLRIRL